MRPCSRSSAGESATGSRAALPLSTEADAYRVLEQMTAAAFEEDVEVAPGLRPGSADPVVTA